MKRADLMHHLRAEGVEVLREGGAHTVVVHRANRKSSSIPRHIEINPYIARKICRDLDVPEPPCR